MSTYRQWRRTLISTRLFASFASWKSNSCHCCGCGHLLLPFDRSNCWWKLMRAAPAGKNKLPTAKNSWFRCTHLGTPIWPGRPASDCVKWIHYVFHLSSVFIVPPAEWKSVGIQIFSYQCAVGSNNKNKWNPVEEHTMQWV